jgi:branched-chain amino acid transport system ATP-binding protein
MAFQSVSVVYNFWSSIMAFRNFHEKAADIISEIGLGLKTREHAANLSHGEQRSLEVGLALASNPELLLLDEPTAGMSLEETKHMVGLIKTIAAERDLTILIVEHKMDVVYAIADRVTVLHQGSILATGTPDEIHGDEEVKSVYLRGGRNHA